MASLVCTSTGWYSAGAFVPLSIKSSSCLVVGSGLQTPAVQLVWHNSEVSLLSCLAGSKYSDPQNSRKELVKLLKQKRSTTDITAIHNKNSCVFFQWLIKLVLFIFI